MATMTVSDNNWNLSWTTSAASTITKTLATAGNFVDKNILVSVTTPAGSATVAGGGLSVNSNYSGTPTVGISLDS